MDATKRHNPDWLDAWDAERKTAAEKPPTGFYTIPDICARLNICRTTAQAQMERGIRDGTIEVKPFLVQNKSGSTVMVNHYRRIAAPSAPIKKASRSRTAQK